MSIWFEMGFSITLINARWHAKLYHDTKYSYVGTFKDERSAAEAVNKRCRELNVPEKNPDLIRNKETVT